MARAKRQRQDKWTAGIAVGGRNFVDTVKALWGFKATGRNVIESDEGYLLREGGVPYKTLFEAEKEDIGPENTLIWDVIQ